jgi:hypothetical protein
MPMKASAVEARTKSRSVIELDATDLRR